MANKIQIKRSTTNAAPTGLANGELAYTANGGVLFIGHPDGSTGTIAIGGLRNPGTLTANQALVANSTLGIDKVIVANLTPTQIFANGAVGTAGQVLTSGAAGNVYWTAPASGVAGSNSQVQFNANGVLSGDAGFTFDGVADALIVGGTGQTTSPTFRVANSTTSANLSSATLTIGTAVVNSSAVAAGSNAYMNVTSVFISTNSTINATMTAAGLQVSNSTGTANLTATTLAIGTSTVNSTAVAAGSNVYLNTTTLFAGNTTVNASHTSSLVQVANSTSSANLTAAGLAIGTITANTTGLYVGANVFANSSAVDVGNTIITTTNLTLGGQVTANGGVGSAGQVLTSGAAGNVYWTTPATGTVTSVTGGNGLTGSVSTTGSLDVGAGNGITVAADSVAVNANSGLLANSTGVFVVANSGIVANSTGVFVSAGDGLVANATGVHVGAANGISVATDAVGVTTGSTLTVNSTGIHVNSSLSITDLVLSGNLDINGTLTTVDTTNLSVTDSLISLARGQTTANTLDIGIYGTYGNATVTSYSGLFRDATDGVYKLFAGAIPEPTTTVDTSNVNFAFATLQSYLTTGALVANSTVVNITANSTVSVALTANSLSLTTALPATSGGTGTGTYTSGDLLVANTGNALSKLSLGADGKVLQSNGTAVVYADLDGGTF